MHAFFVQKCFAQLFSSHILALAKEFLQKSTFVQKSELKMLMRVTIDGRMNSEDF